jgi:YggT family protein
LSGCPQADLGAGNMLMGLLQFIDLVLNVIIIIIIAQVIVSWLLAFNILNMSNQFVATIANALYQITDPLLRPLRAFIPNMGGLDISPIVLFLAIYFIRLVILYPLMRQVAMGGL